LAQGKEAGRPKEKGDSFRRGRQVEKRRGSPIKRIK